MVYQIDLHNSDPHENGWSISYYSTEVLAIKYSRIKIKNAKPTEFGEWICDIRRFPNKKVSDMYQLIKDFRIEDEIDEGYGKVVYCNGIINMFGL